MKIQTGGITIRPNKINSKLIIFLPGLIILIMGVGAFKGPWKDLFILTLILINPIVIAVQGFFTAVTKTSLPLSLLASSIMFSINIYLFMNETALIWLLIYGGIGTVSYALTSFSRKVTKNDYFIG